VNFTATFHRLKPVITHNKPLPRIAVLSTFSLFITLTNTMLLFCSVTFHPHQAVHALSTTNHFKLFSFRHETTFQVAFQSKSIRHTSSCLCTFNHLSLRHETQVQLPFQNESIPHTPFEDGKHNILHTLTSSQTVIAVN